MPGVDAMRDHVLVRLVLVHVLQLLFQKPGGGIKPMQDDTTPGEPHVQRMASPDMRLLMRQDLRPALLHIDPRDDDIFHPTERRDRLLHHDKPHPSFEAGHLARTDQAHDLADGIQEPPCKKEASAGIQRGCPRPPSPGQTSPASVAVDRHPASQAAPRPARPPPSGQRVSRWKKRSRQAAPSG